MNKLVSVPNVYTKIDGLGLRWTDPSGQTHAVEGTDIPGEGTLLWPRCGDGDVRAGEAKFGDADVTCPRCAAILAHHSTDY